MKSVKTGDKIQEAYRASKNVYDAVLTQKNLFARAYIRIFWNGVDDTEIARRVLGFIPEDFTGKLLDAPVGTGVFTEEKYRGLHKAEITALDYSADMLAQAAGRFSDLPNIECVRGDVGNLPFADGSFDCVLSMNGIHAFPDKPAAFTETARVLKPGGMFCGCTYIRGAAKRTDFLVNAVLARKGWFSKPFLTAAELEASLKTHYADVAVRFDCAMAVFRCVKAD